MERLENILQEAIKKSLNSLYKIDLNVDSIIVEIPKDNTKGDYSTNVAMKMAKQVGKNPIDIANELSKELQSNLKNWKKKSKI